MRHESYAQLDVVDELKLRRWARENYCQEIDRDPTWHAVIHEEMQQKDREEAKYDEKAYMACAVVPLPPGEMLRFHRPHADSIRAERLLSVPNVEQVERSIRS